MMLNVEKLAWGVRRLGAGRRPSLEEVASESREICPAEIGNSPPAICLDGALDKITAFSPWTSWEYEEPRVLGRPITHAPTTAHLLRDVRISGAWIYCGAYKAQHGFGPEQVFRGAGSGFARLERAHMVSNSPGSNFFGNFLLDDFPLGLLPGPGDSAIVLETKAYEHEEGYRKILGLPRPPVIHHARVDELVVYTDFAQNALKAERYRELRRRMRRSAGQGEPPRADKVYLKRGATGESRIVLNERALEAHLVKLGFDIIEPAGLTAEEVSRRILDARLVVSVEGSHLSHAIYSIADGGTFLVIEPPDRFATPYKEFADRLEMPFAFLVGDPGRGGFTVDLNELDRLLERLA